VYAGCQWLVFVLLVKSLHLVDVGQFAYWTAVTAPIFVLANMRLRSVLATGVGTPRGFSDYLAARLFTTSIAVGISLLIAMMASTSVAALAVVVLIVCGRACDAMSDICHGCFQRALDMRTAAIGLMANGILSVALVGVALELWQSLTAATAAYAAGSFLALVAWDLPRVRGVVVSGTGAATGTRAVVRMLIWRAMPLGLSAAIGSVQANLPRYVIAAYLGPAALAIFTALAYLPTLGNLVVNAAAQAALPVLARDLKASQASYRSRLRRLVLSGTALGVASVAGTALVGRSALTWIYSASYADQIAVLLWLMAAAGVSYAFVFLGTASTARMRFGSQCLISATGLAVVAAAVVPMVSRYGLVGAACALLAGAVVEACGYIILTVYDLTARPRRNRTVAHPRLAAGPFGPADLVEQTHSGQKDKIPGVCSTGDDRSRGVFRSELAEGVQS
jgi:O-antigen/teichoic acid export membrane protein